MNKKTLLELDKPIIGMIHLNGYNRFEKLEQAKKEIVIMQKYGVSAVMVEDYFGDLKDVVRVLKHLSLNKHKLIYGVNIRRRYYSRETPEETAYGLAEEFGATFIQKDSVIGHLNVKEETTYIENLKKLREKYNKISLLGGVRFKSQPVESNRSLEEDLKIAKTLCDAIVVTGIETDINKIQDFRNIIGEFPLIVGAGLTTNNCIEQLRIADGGIVGSYLKEDHIDSGNVSKGYAKEFMNKVKVLRR